jgi:sporulation protein YlmC with PRC-barrel domain
MILEENFRMNEKEKVRLGALSATTLIGDPVLNSDDEELGQIEDLMVDIETGCIAYAVLSFGGFLGLGDKFYAVPWISLKVDTENECFRFDIDKEVLEDAPGFDKDNWPAAKDFGIVTTVYEFYGVENPYK